MAILRKLALTAARADGDEEQYHRAAEKNGVVE
jgi:hypothetical protein